MTLAQARQVLVLHRRGDRASDPEVEEALALMRSHPELRAWYEEHMAFQDAMRRKFQDLEAPAALKASIEAAAAKIVRPAFPWQRVAWVAAAAAVLVIVLGLSGVLTPEPVRDRFADYRSRMVRMALREYHMDIVTNDMAQLRNYLGTHGGTGAYVVPAGLGRLPLTGGGMVRWRGNPVSMVCFDRGNREMLFLFVMEGTAVPNAPPAAPALTKVNKLMTASWTREGKTYLLVGPEDEEFLRKYF